MDHILNSRADVYFSQCGQDRWFDTVFGKKRRGTCVEVGAFDGIAISNTLLFAKYRDWKCILIEPNDDRFAECQKNRWESICYHGCAYDTTGTVRFRQTRGYSESLSGVEEDYDPRHIERITNEISSIGGNFEIIEKKSFKLQDIFDENKISSIDFISIDTEGCELKVLRGIDFSRMDIKYIMVEDNYGNESLHSFLREQGYKHVATVGDYIYQKIEK